MDDQEYLEPNWDPSSVTIPRLRAILVAHNISYPASAKKAQLIEIFNTSVLPQARKIRAQNARVKRTSRGIEDINTGRRGTGARDDDDDDDDDDESESAPTPASVRSTRRSTRSRTEEPLEVPEPTPRSIRHSTAPPQSMPRASSKHARQSESLREEDEEPTPKRTAPRRSMATPVVRAEPAEDSPFSNENVFQKSGITPPQPRTVDHERRRTTMTSAARDLERRNRELRRHTGGVSQFRPQTDGAVVPTRRTFNVPVQTDDVQPSEEFTPNEQLELTQAEAAGELVPVRRQKAGPGTNAKVSIFVVLAALFCGPAALWRQEKLEVGYCGVGQPSIEVGGVNVPEWAEAIRPTCEPCPPHAFCNELLHTECESGFVLTQHPLSLNGLIPIPPTCEPDSARARKVNAVKERAVEALREQNAEYECGEAAAPELQETALKEAISTKRRKGMSNEEFEDLWSSAMGEISNTDEIVSGSDGTGHATLASTSMASVPLSCAIRRHLRQTLRQYFWQLVGFFLLLSSGGYGRHRITSGRETERKAKQLASLALEKLSIQASMHAQDPAAHEDNYLSMAQLRDDVLRDEFSASRRQKLWERVQKKVEGNSNVRPMVRTGKSGDVGRVWEWVGAVGMLESPNGAGSGNRRKSAGRVSFAGDEHRLLDPAEHDESSLVKSPRGDLPNKRWEESRTYY